MCRFFSNGLSLMNNVEIEIKSLLYVLTSLLYLHYEDSIDAKFEAPLYLTDRGLIGLKSINVKCQCFEPKSYLFYFVSSRELLD